MNLMPRALWLFAAVVVVGIIGLWSSDPLLGSLWRYALVLLLIALLYEGLVARQQPLQLHWQMPARAYLGRREQVGVAIANPTARPARLRWKVLPPGRVALDNPVRASRLAAHGAVVEPVEFQAVRLGQSLWPGVALRLRGVLGLAEWTRHFDEPGVVEILPDTLRAANRSGSSERLGAATVSRAGSGMELFELRDYRPGDSLRSIDWKATARMQRLTVRRMTEEQHLEIMIAIDIGQASARGSGVLTELGHQVNLAARLAEYAIDHDDRVGLVVFAAEPVFSIPPRGGVSAVARIRTALRDLQPRNEESNPLAAVMQIRRLVRHRSLVVMNVDLDDTDGTGQLVQAARLLRPQHLPMLVSIVDTDIDTLASQPARQWLDPYVSLAAQNSRAHVAANAERLRQLGAALVRARPAELDHAVLSTYAELRRRHRI